MSILANVTDRRTVQSTEPQLWKLVGGTPLITLTHAVAEDQPGLQLSLKAEWLNPGGSVKDRPARQILRAGLTTGLLPSRRLLDASSGNTAVAYAMLGAAAAVGVTVCIPTNVSAERRMLLQAYGAEVIDTDPLEGSDGAIRRAREVAAADPDRYWYANQYDSPANVEAHYLTTGPEIWRDTGGTITHLVAGVGTGGTLMGAGKFLREQQPNIRLIAVEPDSAFHGLEGLKHMASAIVPAIYDRSVVDETVHVSTEDAEKKVHELASNHGIFVGWSSGAAVVAAEKLLDDHETAGSGGKVIVVIAPDGGTRYLSEDGRLWEDHRCG